MIRYGMFTREYLSEPDRLETAERAMRLGAEVYVHPHTFRLRADGFEAQATVDGTRYDIVRRATVVEAIHAALDEIPAWTDEEVLMVAVQSGIEVTR